MIFEFAAPSGFGRWLHPDRARMRFAAAALTGALAITGCGSDDASSTASETQVSEAVSDAGSAATPTPTVSSASTANDASTEESDSGESAAPVAQVFPPVDVVNIQTGESLSLQQLAEAGPTLAWFWAPH